MMSIHFDEKGKFFTNIVPKDAIPATIQTLTNRIKGYIYIRQEERIKDELDRPETFIAVTNAVIYNPDGTILLETEFVAINRSHIIWLTPDNDIHPMQ
jgi:Family of unknown function (DUF6812)